MQCQARHAAVAYAVEWIKVRTSTAPYTHSTQKNESGRKTHSITNKTTKRKIFLFYCTARPPGCLYFMADGTTPARRVLFINLVINHLLNQGVNWGQIEDGQEIHTERGRKKELLTKKKKKRKNRQTYTQTKSRLRNISSDR